MNLATIQAWLKSKSITAHTIAAVLFLASSAIVTNQDLRDFILQTFQNHPKIGTVIIALAGIVFKYSHSSSPAGTVALAQVIETLPSAPTQTAVDAAKTATK